MMKRSVVYKSLYLFVVLMFLSSMTKAQSVFKMPSFSGMTLDHKKVDSTYFKNKITFISFFYIGCGPCMKEIPVLNKLNDHFKGTQFQLLAIAPHTPSQLISFNSIDSVTGKAIAGRYRTESIRYPILPECPEDGSVGMSPKCHLISSLFGVSSYPTSVIINGKNEILMTTEGFPMRQNDEETLQEMIRMIEGYLK
jgi:thiol-disulfide isomerase/thioredoxin